MGMSSDAILAYGISLDEELSVPWDRQYNEETEEYEEDSERDLESWWYNLSDLPSYEETYKEEFDWIEAHKNGDYFHDSDLSKEYEKLHPEFVEKTNKFWENYRKKVSECPVEEIVHCTYEDPMYILAIRGTGHLASRGWPEQIDTIEVEEVRVIKAKAFCDKFLPGIKFDPKWYLASLWSY